APPAPLCRPARPQHRARRGRQAPLGHAISRAGGGTSRLPPRRRHCRPSRIRRVWLRLRSARWVRGRQRQTDQRHRRFHARRRRAGNLRLRRDHPPRQPHRQRPCGRLAAGPRQADRRRAHEPAAAATEL
ncbi:MAG: hypothetical protein AVDCRST_MAG23-2849, partial [uncultured Sphingosinicella sp.]